MRLIIISHIVFVVITTNLFSNEQSCSFNGYEVSRHPTTKLYTYDLRCNRGICNIHEDGKHIFSLEEKVVRSKHLTNCVYFKKEIQNFNHCLR